MTTKTLLSKILLSLGAALLFTSSAAADTFLPSANGYGQVIYVGYDGRVVGGPLHGLPYFGVLVGTEGSDLIFGTDGRDVIVGLGGNDAIYGFGGNDQLEGLTGDDYLNGGSGFDIGIGGPGWDVCTYNTELRILCESHGSIPQGPASAGGQSDPPVPALPDLSLLPL
ncbi:calcium-binding protein [Roseimaritima sediminicola]|uniref:calcium-binding protein n=1 Tax=Roseimaritima sediminicola TaxID=2662066 RepID=UPI00192A3B39|nr:hypothetical protein [Roseimaritima sediminicola]